jgi:hypothetical protein
VDDAEQVALGIELLVREVQAGADLGHRVAGDADRHRLALAAAAMEEHARVVTMDVLEREIRRRPHLPHVERSDDVGVRELSQHARLIEEHRDVLRVLGEVRQDPFDREQGPAGALEIPRFQDLGHAADVDAGEQLVMAERNRSLHKAQDPLRAGSLSKIGRSRTCPKRRVNEQERVAIAFGIRGQPSGRSHAIARKPQNKRFRAHKGRLARVFEALLRACPCKARITSVIPARGFSLCSASNRASEAACSAFETANGSKQ